jgi:hypothetical protein
MKTFKGLLGIAAFALGCFACGAEAPDDAVVEDSAASAPVAESVGTNYEPLLPNCPTANQCIAGTSATEGACCRCNNAYGTWGPAFHGLRGCACKDACQFYSTTKNWSGMCCKCQGVQGTFHLSPIANLYKCEL